MLSSIYALHVGSYWGLTGRILVTIASLTLMVTLIGGQQYARWEQAQAPVASYSVIDKQQKHFTAITSNASVTRVYDAGRFELAAVEDTQIANSQPAQERWVF